MIDFYKYKETKQKEKNESRNNLLRELRDINIDLIENSIPEDTGSLDYTMREILRDNEIEKLKDISLRVNHEARQIRDKWKKEGFNPFTTPSNMFS